MKPLPLIILCIALTGCASTSAPFKKGGQALQQVLVASDNIDVLADESTASQETKDAIKAETKSQRVQVGAVQKAFNELYDFANKVKAKADKYDALVAGFWGVVILAAIAGAVISYFKGWLGFIPGLRRR